MRGGAGAACLPTAVQQLRSRLCRGTQALVHHWYLPDSYDSLLPATEAPRGRGARQASDRWGSQRVHLLLTASSEACAHMARQAALQRTMRVIHCPVSGIPTQPPAGQQVPGG